MGSLLLAGENPEIGWFRQVQRIVQEYKKKEMWRKKKKENEQETEKKRKRRGRIN